MRIRLNRRIGFTGPPPSPFDFLPPLFIFFPIENDILSIFLQVKFFDTIDIFLVMIF